MNRYRRSCQKTNETKIHLPIVRFFSFVQGKFFRNIDTWLSELFFSQAFYFSTDIFTGAGLSKEAAARATLSVSVINVLMTFVSLALVERAGRRTLHLVGLGGMAVLTVVLTISLALKDTYPAFSYASVGAVIGFVVFFAVGPGSIPWFLVGELFGQGARPLATSLSVAVNWTANFLVGMCFLPLTGEGLPPFRAF